MRLHATLPGLKVPPKMHLMTDDGFSSSEVTLSTECGDQARVVPAPWSTSEPALRDRLRRAAAIARDTNHPVTHLIQGAGCTGRILYACPVRKSRRRGPQGVLVGSVAAPEDQAQLLVRSMLTPVAQ
jgi:hypothetical protein